MTLTFEDKAAILRSISIDPHLQALERQRLTTAITHEDPSWKKLIAGVTGAAAGFAISRFLKLSTTSQVLVTLAGFGVGRYLLDNSDDSNQFMAYNKQLKSYKLNT